MNSDTVALDIKLSTSDGAFSRDLHLAPGERKDVKIDVEHETSLVVSASSGGKVITAKGHGYVMNGTGKCDLCVTVTRANVAVSVCPDC